MQLYAELLRNMSIIVEDENKLKQSATIINHMKKQAYIIIALLCTAVQGAWAWTGSGTESDPYQISTADDWITLCNNVNNNSSNYSGKFFKLMADITVQETITGAPGKAARV